MKPKTEREREHRVNWLAAAPEGEPERRDYFVRLISLLSFKISSQTMAECVAQAPATA